MYKNCKFKRNKFIYLIVYIINLYTTFQCILFLQLWISIFNINCYFKCTHQYIRCKYKYIVKVIL